MFGQIGQVPNQAGPSLPGPPSQNASSQPGRIQHSGVNFHMSNTGSELVKARKLMVSKIYEYFSLRQKNPDQKKLNDLAKHAEEILFRNAARKHSNSLEEYLNDETFERRLLGLFNRQSANGQHLSHVNSSPRNGAMIPTPRMPQSGNSCLSGTSSLVGPMICGGARDAIMVPSVNSGSSLPLGNAPPRTMGGASHSSNSSQSIDLRVPAHGYQRPPSSFIISSGGNNVMSSGGNNVMSSIDLPSTRSHMIPTPGFNNTSNDTKTHRAIPQYFTNSELSKDFRAFSSAESTAASKRMQQKQYDDVQINDLPHMSCSNKSDKVTNGGTGSALIVNGPGASRSSLSPKLYDSAPQPFQPHFSLQHQPPIQGGDGYGISNSVSFGCGDLHIPDKSVGSVMDVRNLNAVASHLMPIKNFPSLAYQSNIHSSQQVTDAKLQSVDQLANVTFQTHSSMRDNHVKSHQPPKFLQQANKVHHQHQQKQQDQLHQLVSKCDAFGDTLSSSQQGTDKKSEPTMKSGDGAFQGQGPQFLPFPDAQNQFPQSSAETHTTTVLPCQLYSKSLDGSRACGIPPYKQNVEEELSERIIDQDKDPHYNLSSAEVIICQPSGTKSAKPHAVCRSGNLSCERQFTNQTKWLLFLLHAKHCSAPKGTCADRNCETAQQLLKHMEQCKTVDCKVARCHPTTVLIDHFRHCEYATCPVCPRVRKFVSVHSTASAQPRFSSNGPSAVKDSCKSVDMEKTTSRSTWSTCPVDIKNTDEAEPSPKRMKSEQSMASQTQSSFVQLLDVRESCVFQETQLAEESSGAGMRIRSDGFDVKIEDHSSLGQGVQQNIETKRDNMDDTDTNRSNDDPIGANNTACSLHMEKVIREQQLEQHKLDDMPLPTKCPSGPKPVKSTVKCVSLTELFTPEQVREHIKGLRQWVGQSRAKAEKNQAMEHFISENSCQLCAVEKLTFEPPLLYCTPCGSRIKRNAMYYTGVLGGTRHYFCIPCYNEARGDTILVDRTALSKAMLDKKKNDEETEESWVQCDKCEAWQHQICALFNCRRNAGEAEYTCPNCYVADVERGERGPLPQSTLLGAKDLPRTILSDHIEQRLFCRLEQERRERARHQRKTYDEVPGAEGLVVRIVSSVDKRLEVKPRFIEIFQEEDYPTEFPYKSKVLLLFQQIEGVEVCIFGMYVQEFGSDCQQPNHRRLYISYLDSVKYFRPEVKTVSGEALRTFVYHEMLIGYLEYCKKRGFTSCYIWACPPLKGEDYILYCHPEIQKTPRSDKLREWYLSMLRKAAQENIVVDLTNFYDHFFVSAGDCKAKVTASRLPYFDGDYWPGAAEDILYQLHQEEEERKQNRKGAFKVTKRARKASRQTDLSSNEAKDRLLMQKLGETISPMKEDFIMVHLQHVCSHCCILMVYGNRWMCRECKSFQLCDKCYQDEQQLHDIERHPTNLMDKHTFYPVEINDVPAYTKDDDEILESEFFDTRQAFLGLCQGNHYQYDTLRRAKHSSMMLLYHLHNPTAPAFITTCRSCNNDIETGQGWHCEVCPDYDVCNACQERDGGVEHPHKLTNHPTMVDRDGQNIEARELRVLQFTKMLELLVHASGCRSPRCQYLNCRKIKGLFHHGRQCAKRLPGGCVLCKRMWYMLQVHANSCKASNCSVPRCRDLKEHMRRQQQQSESRRRAAVMEMMRQRTAEVARNTQ